MWMTKTLRSLSWEFLLLYETLHALLITKTTCTYSLWSRVNAQPLESSCEEEGSGAEKFERVHFTERVAKPNDHFHSRETFLLRCYRHSAFWKEIEGSCWSYWPKKQFRGFRPWHRVSQDKNLKTQYILKEVTHHHRFVPFYSLEYNNNFLLSPTYKQFWKPVNLCGCEFERFKNCF